LPFPGPHRDPDIGPGQRRRVVDAVPDEGDLAAGGEFADHPHLVLGQHVGVDVPELQ